MRIEGPALLVRVYLGETDKWEGKNLYLAIIELLGGLALQARPCSAASRASGPSSAGTRLAS